MLLVAFITRSPIWMLSILVSVSVREHISGTTLPIYTNFLHVAYCHGSVLLGRCCDTYDLWTRHICTLGIDVGDANKAYTQSDSTTATNTLTACYCVILHRER